MSGFAEPAHFCTASARGLSCSWCCSAMLRLNIWWTLSVASRAVCGFDENNGDVQGDDNDDMDM